MARETLGGPENDSSYLWDMLDAARAISEFVRDRSYQDYTEDRMLRSAVERQLEIIGEAANKVSRNYREAHPENYLEADHCPTPCADS